MPLFVRSQHHRHRTWSYNEISRRYTEENLKFYEPKEFRTQAENNRQASNENELIDPLVWFSEDDGTISKLSASTAMKLHHKKCIDFYDLLLDEGVCREQARGVLPQNLYTEYYGTVNLSNLMKFIKLRDHEGAQWEIIKVARACKTIAKELWPVTFDAFEL